MPLRAVLRQRGYVRPAVRSRRRGLRGGAGRGDGGERTARRRRGAQGAATQGSARRGDGGERRAGRRRMERGLPAFSADNGAGGWNMDSRPSPRITAHSTRHRGRECRNRCYSRMNGHSPLGRGSTVPLPGLMAGSGVTYRSAGANAESDAATLRRCDRCDDATARPAVARGTGREAAPVGQRVPRDGRTAEVCGLPTPPANGITEHVRICTTVVGCGDRVGCGGVTVAVPAVSRCRDRRGCKKGVGGWR